jgi:hypothetical protein
MYLDDKYDESDGDGLVHPSRGVATQHDGVNADYKKYERIIKGLKKERLIFIIENHYIDSLTYDEKVVLLKEILCGFISSDPPRKINNIQDKYDKMIFEFFKLNLLYKKPDEDKYYAFEAKRGEVVGFFLCNPEEYDKNEKSANKMPTMSTFTKNFDYYVYNVPDEGEGWNKISKSIAIDSIYDSAKEYLGAGEGSKLFNTKNIWGYSSKGVKTKHVFRLVKPKSLAKDIKPVVSIEPGQIIGDAGDGMSSLIRDFQEVFPENYIGYTDLLEDTLRKKIQIKIQGLEDGTEKKKRDEEAAKKKKKKLTKKEKDKIDTEIEEELEELEIRNEEINEELEKLEDEEDLKERGIYLFKNLTKLKEKDFISKKFISKMYELSTRSRKKFFSYDTFLFKFIND